MKKYLIIASILVLGSTSTHFVAAQSYTFNNDLRLGSTGIDVANLQTWLIANGFTIPSISSGNAKGYYGFQTMAAVMAYQKSVGLPAYGYFGPLTRVQINSGNGSRGASLQVTSPNGGEVWQLGTNHSITWTGSNGVLNQTADIKLEYPLPACAQPGQPIRCMILVRAPIIVATNINLSLGTYSWNVGTANGAIQAPTNCDPYPAGYSGSTNCPQPASLVPVGQYKIEICPTNGSQCAEGANTFTVSSSTVSTGAGPLQIISPNGGETWQTGTTQMITWSSPYYFRATNVDLKLQRQYICTSQVCPMIAYAPFTIAQGIPANQNSYSWVVGQYSNLTSFPYTTGNVSYVPDGQYSIQICESGTSNCDSSNGNFTISSNSQTSSGSISLISPNGGEVWPANSTERITWNVNGNTDPNQRIDLYLGNMVQVPCAYNPYNPQQTCPQVFRHSTHSTRILR